MNFESVVSRVKAEKCAGIRYQQAGHHHFRDRVTVYRDGKLLFERFCYGEAAGIVFSVWAKSDDGNGSPLWDFTGCNVTSAPQEVPHTLTDADENSLEFDGKSIRWECTQKLKSDSANGYGGPVYWVKRLFGAV